MTTADRILVLIIVGWAILIALYLLVIVPVSEASPIWGDDDVVCGVWTYYAPNLAERVRQTRGLPACADCAGLAVTVDRRLLGEQIQIRHAGEWIGPFQVIDVGTGRHRPHLVGEIDYPTAVAWRIAGPWWTCYRVARREPWIRKR